MRKNQIIDQEHGGHAVIEEHCARLRRAGEVNFKYDEKSGQQKKYVKFLKIIKESESINERDPDDEETKLSLVEPMMFDRPQCKMGQET